jgi:hypothetical protein
MRGGPDATLKGPTQALRGAEEIRIRMRWQIHTALGFLLRVRELINLSLANSAE